MISEAVIDSIDWHDLGVLSGSGGELATTLEGLVHAKSQGERVGGRQPTRPSAPRP